MKTQRSTSGHPLQQGPPDRSYKRAGRSPSTGLGVRTANSPVTVPTPAGLNTSRCRWATGTAQTPHPSAVPAQGHTPNVLLGPLFAIVLIATPAFAQVPQNVRCVKDSFGNYTCDNGTRIIKDSFDNFTIIPGKEKFDGRQRTGPEGGRSRP
jgi:hypothetical protein